ncbi:MAG: ral nucleoside transport system ATP-binding protein [Solirubrobacteraceae bacterium]|nr:ral nucleoside transport system ATP-binding protein [Solirubrobacteraceae bacterium]
MTGQEPVAESAAAGHASKGGDEGTAGAPAVPRVALRGFGKRFGDVVAGDDVSVDLWSGEVHALLGENGAGKTTLMNILSGMVRPDEGAIFLDGRSVAIRSPRHASDLGIGMVHQHFRLIDRMTVAENLHLGWRESPRIRRERAVAAHVGETLGRLGLDLDPSAYIADLSVAEQQLVEIARTLARGARVLILDEPTAVLSPPEAENLFAMIRGVVADGTAVVFISHKLREVLAIADRISIMRSGRMVASLDAGAADEGSLARLMIGRDLSTQAPHTPPVERRPMLAAEALCADNDRGLRALHDVSLEVCGGEVVGVAGVAGNGQRELAEVLAGLRPPTSGTITVDGRELAGEGSRVFIDAGVGYVPEDRYGTGLVPGEPIWRNAVLRSYRTPKLSPRGVFRRGAAKAAARELCDDMQVSTTDVDRAVRQLSGGNAQRLLSGRELDAATCVVIAAHPTRGIDVGGAEAVRGAILAGRSRGLATVVISDDLDELLALSDRLLVLYEGRFVGEFEAGSVDEETLGLLMGTGHAGAGVAS